MKKNITIVLCVIAWGLLVRPPVSGGRLTSIWGVRFSTDRFFHTGSDIGHVVGTPVFPIIGGTIKEASFHERNGNFVFISHIPGVETRYLHLDTITSSMGDKVNYHTVIGTLGNTGISSGPHIHFEIRLFGVPLPAYLLCLPGRIIQRVGVHKALNALTKK